MRQNNIIRAWIVLVLIVVAATLVAAPVDARHRGFRGRIIGPGFGISPYPYWGYPTYVYGAFYGLPGPYFEVPRLNPAVAAALDVGAIDLDVRPRKADVFVDGKFVGKARDFDGSPGYLWLRAGSHTVTIYRGGYATLEEELSVEAGLVRAIKLRLTPGDSSPPPSPKPNGKTEATTASVSVF